MQPRKFSVATATFPFGGNSGVPSESPHLRHWWTKTALSMARDERIIKPVPSYERALTPLSMSRNWAAKQALDAGNDFLLMCDSDMAPDLYPGQKPFWDTAFDLAVGHYDKGPCIVGAPCCGAPPHPVSGGKESLNVFIWRTVSNHPDHRWGYLRPVEREEAATRAGVERVAAIGAGLILIDMRIFKMLPPPWFDYEWRDKYRTQMLTSEDIYFVRNASMLGIPVYVLWDCWAGHCKPYISGKPQLIAAEDVAAPYREAVLRGLERNERLVDFNAEKSQAEIMARYKPSGDGKPTGMTAEVAKGG